MKKILVFPILLLAAAAAWGAVYPVTETFSGSSQLSSNWTDLAKTNSGYTFLQATNSTVIPSVAGQQGMAIYTGTSFSNDQYSQVKFVSHVGSNSSTGPCVRMSATGNGVCYLADLGLMYLLSGGNGAGDINSSCPIPNTGDTIQLSVVGTTYTCSDLTTGATASTNNYTFSSGSPAILVDQRPSSRYALAQFQGDCIPSCSGGASGGSSLPQSGNSTSSPTDPSAPPATNPSTPPSSGPSDPSANNPPPATSPDTPVVSNPSSGSGQTWYVNGGGGTRYSVNQPGGQCNGMSQNPYPGSGVNQNCAFKDIRSLWTDGSYVTAGNTSAPAWGWIGSSGDTYIVDCSGGALCRIGQNGPNVQDYYGLAGDPYDSGVPPPINGTPGAHTRILGAGYASCTSAAAKAHVNGGYGLYQVFNLQGSSYVDISCFDITDFSNCGKVGQSNTCNTVYPIDDFSTNGIRVNNSTNNVTLTDVSIHGMANSGILGPTGDGVVLTRVSLMGNPGTGWNLDDGSGTTGSGHLTLSYVSIMWNGCAEEYPIVHATPYADCTDDNSNGYGDGIGTATVPSNPAWTISVDHSVAAYNTQDGFDFLHVNGPGSSVSITNTLAYGNMGQQIKVGAVGSAINNLIVGNCNALRQGIPGTPSGYNSKLSDFCRAADTAAVISVGDGAVTRFINNTVYSANNVALEVSTAGSCTSSCFMQYENNIFLGFLNSAANGYPSGGNGRYPAPIFFDDHPVLSLSGSSFTNNLTWNPKDSWSCPQTSWNEQNAICADPGLADETYHLYGYGNMSPASASSIVVGKGISISGLTTDILNNTRSGNPTLGAYDATASSASLP